MNAIRTLDVCSGYSASTLAWAGLPFRHVGYAEIDAFPRAVLEQRHGATAVDWDHRWTEGSNTTPLFGDFTKIEAHHVGPVDLLTGGTPCQDFSIAGLRAGLGGDRGNLTLEFLRLADRVKPEWILWENVPGILSDKGNALAKFLDGLEELGYVADVDILDAQFFGVAQRRRRVFVCAQHKDHILRQRTPSSSLTIAQCAVEILHGILADSFNRYGRGLNASEQAALSLDGAKRRTKLFGLLTDTDAWTNFRENLEEVELSSSTEPKNSVSKSGKPRQVGTPAAGSKALPTAGPSMSTAPSLSDALDALYEAMKSFTISTSTKTITPTQIYTYSQAGLTIADRICRLSGSSPSSWSAAASALILTREITSYARSAGSDLFARLDGVHAWHDLVGQALQTADALGNLRVQNFGKVLPIPESLRGDSAPRREAGQGIAPTISARTKGGGGLGTDFDCDGGLIPQGCGGETAPTLNAAFGSKLGLDNQHIDSGAGLFVAHSLRADGFDASEDGTGRGTPLVPVAYSIMPQNSGKDYKAREVDVAQPLMAGGPVGGNQGGDVIAFAIQAGALRENPASGPDGVGVQADHSYTLEARSEVQAVAFAEPFHGESYVEALRALREAVGAEAFEAWGLGAAKHVQSPEVLRSEVHGSGVRCPSDHGNGLDDNSLPRPQIGASGAVWSLWSAGCVGRPPQGWRPPEQLAEQLGAAMSKLPQSGASRDRFMRDLWEAAEGLGLLRKALSAFQEMGRPARGKDQPEHAAWAVRRLTPLECARLMDVPDDFLRITYRGKSAADGPQYKALGNSQARNVMRWLGRGLADVIAAQGDQP